MNEINDIRLPKEFNGISFSNFKKTDVRKELLNSLNNNKIENACNWSAELICAGHFSDLWEIIIYNIGKNIHLANPKIPIYVDMRFQNFKEIVQNGYIGNEIAMRNNEKIRTIFCELITILCLSNKKPAFECVKIKKEEFNLLNLTNKFKAPDTSYALTVFDKNDPKEIFIPINELIYHLTKSNSNLLECCYWIEWIVEFDNICRKKKENLTATSRTFPVVDDKYRSNIIWIIWDIFFDLCKTDTMLTKIVTSILHVFCIKYTLSMNKKRRYLLYFVVELLTEKFNDKIPIYNKTDEKLIETVKKQVEKIYKNIKKNEKSPKTDYLFNEKDEGKTNLKKTIEKIDTMNTISFIPRS
tara:strand:+ start:143 stop:1210 length:1068 start_codon:yes stop_codon:yes gene_type:complete